MEKWQGAVEGMAVNTSFWRGRRVVVTGHTGFKGAWLLLWLESLGAQVAGVALPPATDPNLFDELAPWRQLVSTFGDLREPKIALDVLNAAQPEIVFHLAAQALVRSSYHDPIGTFATNVLGTAHLLEAVRKVSSVKVVLVVTSDKVYENDGGGRPLREGDQLGGGDPYSASKACQEILAAAYRKSFFGNNAARVACARAGNVIGGGDWAPDRLLPDFVRATRAGRAVEIRYPDATRPWQHVLEPLAGYLLYAERLYSDSRVPLALNFGPAGNAVQPVRWVVERLVGRWGSAAAWRQDSSDSPPEALALTLDSALARQSLGWQPRLELEQALDWTVAWYRAQSEGQDMRKYSLAEAQRYQGIC